MVSGHEAGCEGDCPNLHRAAQDAKRVQQVHGVSGHMATKPAGRAKAATATSGTTGGSRLGSFLNMNPPKKVRKIGGSFQHTGTVVSEFKTIAGEPRIVVEFDPPVSGMLHIYRPDQVEGIENQAL